MLRNYKGRKINFLDDENGKQISDKEARRIIAELQAKGHKLLPGDGCEGFDPFGGGCPGHEIKELDTTSIEGYGKVETCEICNGKFELKITEGFVNNAMKTFELMDKAMKLAGEDYPLLDKLVTDNGIFHLILKSKKTQ
jgi:hypothetical protein